MTESCKKTDASHPLRYAGQMHDECFAERQQIDFLGLRLRNSLTQSTFSMDRALLFLQLRPWLTLQTLPRVENLATVLRIVLAVGASALLKNCRNFRWT